MNQLDFTSVLREICKNKSEPPGIKLSFPDFRIQFSFRFLISFSSRKTKIKERCNVKIFLLVI